MKETAMTSSPLRRAWSGLARFRLPRPPRSAVLLAALLLVNELWSNVSVIVECFWGAKVMRSLSTDVTGLAWQLGTTLAGMLLIMALLLLGVAWCWMAVCRVVAADVTARFGNTRPVRLVFWFAALLAFINTWYSVHAYMLPASALRDSWLSMLSGALCRRPVDDAGRLVVPVIMAAGTAALLLRALRLSPPLRRQLAGAACTVALLVAGWGWWRAPGPVAPFTQQNNVVLLGLDSLQMNRLTAGGALQEIAPHIDGFLQQCYRFDNAWTPLARTYPSWISILTGREPVHDGVRFNLIGDDHLDRDNVYLPQTLAERGYATLHATDETRFSIIRPRFGFQSMVHPRMGAQDFLLASFFDFSASNLLRQSRLGDDMFPAVAGNRASVAYAPDLWVQDTIAAIDALPRDRPVFIAMHLCGDHWPFSTPAPYSHDSADPVDCCIRMIDAQAGAILEHLRAVGLMDRSTVAMLSDHGDGWSGIPGDPNNSHGDDLRSPWANRIVLGFHAPDLAPGTCAELVRSYDIAPTILDLLHVSQDPATMDGRSLLPLLRGGSPGAPRELFAETDLDRRVYTVKQLVQQNALWYRTDPASGLVFLREEGFAEFMPLKWYMVVSGNRRLVAVPFKQRFEVHELDPATGRDKLDSQVAAIPAADRAALLDQLIEHFGLDGQSLRQAAQSAGFLPRQVAAR
jgi:arylsulfatase A-like enzyme